MMVTKSLAVAVLAALAPGGEGCFSLPLMVGSLGYEGYEYEKTGTFAGNAAEAVVVNIVIDGEARSASDSFT
jgi:hypothetical protein